MSRKTEESQAASRDAQGNFPGDYDSTSSGGYGSAANVWSQKAQRGFNNTKTTAKVDSTYMSEVNEGGRKGADDNEADSSASVAVKLEYALKKVSKQAAQYEGQMKDLESKLSENLSNFRAIDSLLSEAFSGLQRNTKRADRAAHQQVPRIHRDLQESREVLEELGETLPTVRAQVQDIFDVYESGRQKAKNLVEDLNWLNTEFYERWRMIVFTSSSPVSLRWKIIMRTLFVVSFILCCWVSWIALKGAYRAHSHRLVWGDKLMS
ncbi:hypothetical protein MD484_g1722, partial [Candolleomyces efflorescens]